jgi:hypothetical protein
MNFCKLMTCCFNRRQQQQQQQQQTQYPHQQQNRQQYPQQQQNPHQQPNHQQNPHQQQQPQYPQQPNRQKNPQQPIDFNHIEVSLSNDLIILKKTIESLKAPVLKNLLLYTLGLKENLNNNLKSAYEENKTSDSNASNAGEIREIICKKLDTLSLNGNYTNSLLQNKLGKGQESNNYGQSRLNFIAFIHKSNRPQSSSTDTLPPDLSNYDPTFWSMKYNSNFRPGKALVRAVTKATIDITDKTALNIIDLNKIGDSTSYKFNNNGGTITGNTLKQELKSGGISFSTQSEISRDEYFKLIQDPSITNQDYSEFRNCKDRLSNSLMLEATQIVTSNKVRFTYTIAQHNPHPICDNISAHNPVTMLNASGLDFTDANISNLSNEDAKKYIAGLFEALADRIKQEKLTHVSLVQIGMGEFLGNKKGTAEKFYKNGIIKLTQTCPNVNFYLPEGLFTVDQRDAINNAGVVSHSYDAIAVTQHLIKDPNNRVGMLNPSDPTVTFGAYPFGCLSMTGRENDFVGEEALGQVTTGSLWSVSHLHT